MACHVEDVIKEETGEIKLSPNRNWLEEMRFA